MDARVFIHGSWLQITARKGTCQLKQPMNLQGKTFRVCWRYDTFMVNPPCPWEIDKTLGILAGANLTPKFSQFPWDISLCPSWLSQLQVAQSWHIPSGKLTKSYWKSPFLMGKLTISMVIFNSFLYVYQAGYRPSKSATGWVNCRSFLAVEVAGMNFGSSLRDKERVTTVTTSGTSGLPMCSDYHNCLVTGTMEFSWWIYGYIIYG